MNTKLVKIAAALCVLLHLGCGLDQEGNRSKSPRPGDSSVAASNYQIYTSIDDLKVLDPSVIDSNAAIAFIDTTYYSYEARQIENWSIVKSGDWIDREVLQSRSIDYSKDFANSSKWFRLRKLGDTFYRYERSDGADTRYELSDNYLLIFGVHEPLVYKIDKRIKSAKGDTLTFDAEGNEIIALVKTEHQDVLKLDMKLHNRFHTEYIAPRRALKSFRTIVNHTPKGKQRELFGW